MNIIISKKIIPINKNRVHTFLATLVYKYSNLASALSADTSPFYIRKD